MVQKYLEIVQSCTGKNYRAEFKRINSKGELVFLAIAEKGYKYDASGNKRRNKLTKSFSFAEKTPKKQIVDELIHQSKLLLEQLEGGVIKSNDDITLFDFVPQYLATKKENLSPSVYNDYVKFIERYVIPALGHFKLKEIEPKHAQAFLNQIVNAPKIGRDGKPSTTGEKVSAETVKRKFAILQSILSCAVDQRIIPYNPADARYVTFPKAKIIKKKEKGFTVDEIKDILCLVRKESDIQIKTLLFLAIFTGLREGELVGLKFADIDFDDCSLTVLRSIGKHDVINPPKGKKQRTIPLSRECIKLLQELKQKHLDDSHKLGTKWIGEDWVFTQWNGKRMDLTRPWHIFNDFQLQHNIPHHRLHLIRHAFATIAAEQKEVSLKTVQEMLGHASITTTSIYLHSNYDAMRNAIDTLDESLADDTATTA